MISKVPLSIMAEAMRLTYLTPEIDMSDIQITTPEINRPALQLAGYYEHFANERVQIIGYVEYTYIMQMSREERLNSYEKFISSSYQ